MMQTTACQSGAAGFRVYHGFGLEVGSGLGVVRNMRYRYGELGWQSRPAAKAGVGTTMRLTMEVPEEFEISWETEDGVHHEATVPVRSRLSGSIEGKLILFVIMQNEVQGFVLTSSSTYGSKRERFF
jgi:hypothetical protein